MTSHMITQAGCALDAQPTLLTRVHTSMPFHVPIEIQDQLETAMAAMCAAMVRELIIFSGLGRRCER